MGSETKVAQGSAERFGYEWSTYAEILPESKAQLELWLGSTGLASFAGKSVVDVGCGMGRNPYWMAKAGAKSVLAIDVDEGSLSSARRNLAPLENVEVKKLSAFEMSPEQVGLRDRVTCIGVLHHLPTPEEALEKMWSCLKPGGDLVLWVYGRDGNRLILPLIQGFRFVGSRLPLPITHLVAKGVTRLAWPAIRLVPWRTEYYRKLRRLSLGNVESIIFDQMIPRIAHYWTEEDLRRLTKPLGGRTRIELVQGNSWHVRVEKT